MSLNTNLFLTQCLITLRTRSMNTIQLFVLLYIFQRQYFLAIRIVLASNFRHFKYFGEFRFIHHQSELSRLRLLTIAAFFLSLLPFGNARFTVDSTFTESAIDGDFLFGHNDFLANEAIYITEKILSFELLSIANTIFNRRFRCF